MSHQMVNADDRLITDKEVAHLLGASRSWPWKLVQAGKFPVPVRITPRCTRWRLSEVKRWMADPQAWQQQNLSGVDHA